MPPEIRAVPADDATRDRIIEVLATQAETLGVPFEPVDVAFEARDGDRWLGGLMGHTMQQWLFVQFLGVAPEAQGRGVGRALMAQAEDLAREQGLVGVWLDTFSFQAPDFYARLGYEEVGRIRDYPPGHARIFLVKRLDGRPLGEPVWDPAP